MPRLLNLAELRGSTQAKPIPVPFGGTTRPAFVDRVNNPQSYPYISNPDGSVSTHRMSAEIDEEGRYGPPGKWYVFPTIVNMPGGLKQFDSNREAMDYNVRTGNALQFDDGQEARAYSINYKAGTPLAGGTGRLGIDDQPQGTDEMAPVRAINSLTPEQLQEFLRQIAPQRPIDNFRDPRVTQEMIPVEPTWNPFGQNFRGTLNMAMEDLFTPVGEGQSAGDRYYGRKLIRNTTGEPGGFGMMDFIPGVDIPLAYADARRAIEQGHYGEAALIGGGTLAGNLFPFAKPAIKGLRRSGLDDVLPRADVSTKPIKPITDPIVTKTGRWVGTSENVNSEQTLEGLRGRLQQSLERGMPGRDWYTQSSDYSDFLTGGRQGYRDAFTGALAIGSQNTRVVGNRLFGVRGYNQAMTGQPIQSGQFPGAFGGKYNELLSGQPTELGPKVGVFYESLNVRPGQVIERSTNDVWMGHAFEFKPKYEYKIVDGKRKRVQVSRSFTDAQHAWMDSEINKLTKWANETKLGGHNNWTNEKVQASIWTDTKARTEGLTIAEAAEDFGRGYDDLTVNLNIESMPGRGTDHLAGLADEAGAPEALQSMQRQILTDPQTGQDIFSLSTGALTPETYGGGFGYYAGRSNPTDVAPILGAPARGARVIEPGSRAQAEAVSAAHGLIRGQESVGYNFIRPGGSLMERNAGQVNIGVAPSQEQMLSVGRRLDGEFGGSIVPVNNPDGVSFLVVGDLTDWMRKTKPDVAELFDLIKVDDLAKELNISVDAAAELKKLAMQGGKELEVQQILGSISKSSLHTRGPASQSLKNVADRTSRAWQNRLDDISLEEFNVSPEWGVNSGDIVGDWNTYKPSAYLPALEQIKHADQLSRQLQIAAPSLDQVDEALRTDFPNVGERGAIITRVREALAKGGVPEVRRLVELGILPAIVLSVFGGTRLLPEQSAFGNGEI